jgi:serine/threonine-protein kinase
MPPALAAYVARCVAEALEAVHSAKDAVGEPLGIVHRDVTPSNVYLSIDGEVKLGDFGIARAAHHVSLTLAGRVVGKPGYMAPEQARAEPFDARADLFALGLTLYEALTGLRVIPCEARQDPRWGFTSRTFPPPSTFRPEVPPLLDAIVLELLQWEPHARTPGALRLREQLCSLIDEAAPYPRGQALLARAVHEALANRPTEPVVTQTPRESGPQGVRLRPSGPVRPSRSLPQTRLDFRPSRPIPAVVERTRS